MTIQFMFLFLLGLISLTTAQDKTNQECFETGECRNSYLLEFRKTFDKFECLEFCNSNPECAWATYFPSTSYCELLKNCATLDAEVCSDCLTTKRECIPDEPVCWIEGECEGIVDLIVPTSSADDCLQLCSSTFGCHWFTFYARALECVILKTCSTIDESCNECISGERRCITESSTTTTESSTTERPTAITKLLVAGGAFLYDDEYFFKSVEVVNLDESKPDLVCDNLPDLPFKLAGLAGQLYRGSKPLLCGGMGEQFVSCDCYTYEYGGWKKIESLLNCTYLSSSATFTLPNKEEILFLTGGYSDRQEIPTVQSYNGSYWSKEMFSDLPEPNWKHCLVKINNSLLLLIGGETPENPETGNTFFFHIDENRWTPGPALNFPREGLGCGIIEWLNPSTNHMEQVVVAAGGMEFTGTISSLVELLFLNEFSTGNISWGMGPSLPTPVSFATAVEFQNSIILIGGMDEINNGNNTYKLSSPDGSWVQMKQTLKELRCGHTAFLVPDELVNCH